MTYIIQHIIPHIEAIIAGNSPDEQQQLFSGDAAAFDKRPDITIQRVSETNPLCVNQSNKTTTIQDWPVTFKVTFEGNPYWLRRLPSPTQRLRATITSENDLLPPHMTVHTHGEQTDRPTLYTICGNDNLIPADQLSPDQKHYFLNAFTAFATAVINGPLSGNLPYLDLKTANLALNTPTAPPAGLMQKQEDPSIVITDTNGFTDSIYKTTPEIGLHKDDQPKYTNNQQTYFVHQVMALNDLQQKVQPMRRAGYPSDTICDALIDLATNKQQDHLQYDPFTQVRSQLTESQPNPEKRRETIRTFWRELLRKYPTQHDQEWQVFGQKIETPSRRNYWDMFMALPRAFAATMIAVFAQLTPQKNKSKPEDAQPWDTNSLHLQNGLCKRISNQIAQVANYPKNASTMASEIKKNQLTEIEKALAALDAALATSTTDRELSLIITNITKLQEQLSALTKPLRRHSKLHHASELSPIIKELGFALRQYRWQRANLDLTHSLTKATAEGIIKLITNNPSEFGSETKRTKALKLTRELLINLDETLQEKVQDAKTITENAKQVARQLKSVCYHRYVSRLFGRPRLQNDQEIKDQISDYQALAERYRALSILQKATEKIKQYGNQEQIQQFYQQAKLVAKHIDIETDLELIKQFDQLTYQAARRPKKITDQQHKELIALSTQILIGKAQAIATDERSSLKRRNSAIALQPDDETATNPRDWDAIAAQENDLEEVVRGNEFKEIPLDDDPHSTPTV